MNLEVKSIGDSKELQISLKPQRIVRIKIVDESGKALSGAQVELVDPAQNDMRVAVTDDQGARATDRVKISVVN